MSEQIIIKRFKKKKASADFKNDLFLIIILFTNLAIEQSL